MGTWSHSNFNLLGIAAYSHAFILYPYHWLHLPLDGLGRNIDTSMFRGWRSLSSFTRQVSWKPSQALALWNLLSSYLWRWAGMEEIRLSLYLSFPLPFLCSRTFFFALRVQISFSNVPSYKVTLVRNFSIYHSCYFVIWLISLKQPSHSQ